MSKPVMEIKDRIIEALRDSGMTQQELADAAKIPKASMSQYVNGVVKPKQDRLYKMAIALKVDPAWLLGFDTPEKNKAYTNIKRVEKRSIPMMGEISCGKPTFCNEEREIYVSADADLDADFCLTAHGDSMIGARINDGDLVFIHQQPTVENGEIAAVVIGDEATLKRVYYYSDSDMVSLVAENPKYPPLVYKNSELDQIVILGKAIAFQSNVI